MIFTILSSRSFIHFFCLSCSAIDSLLCISVYLFFSSFRSLVNTSCIFPILFLRSWILEIYLYLLQFFPLPTPHQGFILLLHLRQYNALSFWLDFPGGSDGKASACNVRDLRSIPGSGRFPGERNKTHYGTLAWKITWMEDPGRLHPTLLGCPRALALDDLLHAPSLHWSSILYMVIYI